MVEVPMLWLIAVCALAREPWDGLGVPLEGDSDELQSGGWSHELRLDASGDRLDAYLAHFVELGFQETMIGATRAMVREDEGYVFYTGPVGRLRIEPQSGFSTDFTKPVPWAQHRPFDPKEQLTEERKFQGGDATLALHPEGRVSGLKMVYQKDDTKVTQYAGTWQIDDRGFAIEGSYDDGAIWRFQATEFVAAGPQYAEMYWLLGADTALGFGARRKGIKDAWWVQVVDAGGGQAWVERVAQSAATANHIANKWSSRSAAKMAGIVVLGDPAKNLRDHVQVIYKQDPTLGDAVRAQLERDFPGLKVTTLHWDGANAPVVIAVGPDTR